MVYTESEFNQLMESIEPEPSKEELWYSQKSFKILNENNLPYIHDLYHFAHIIDIPSKQLKFLILNKNKGYVTFDIPKKSGELRQINAPSKLLKTVQRWILDNILYKTNPGDYAHGFIPERSIYTNAEIHVGQDLIMGIDIKDFFPSIKVYRVFRIFKNIGYKKFISKDFAELYTYKSKLPQGAPTSPMLANLAAKNMDLKLSKFCEKYGLNYSRYADDITISGSKRLQRYKTLIFRIITNYGFKINKEKFRIFGRGFRQCVTGLVVNEKVSIGRKKKKLLRAIIHNIEKNGPIVENRNNDPFFKERLKGHLAFTYMVNPEFAKPLLTKFHQIDWSDYDLLYKYHKNGELFRRNMIKSTKNIPIKFNELDHFKDIREIKSEDFISIQKRLDELQEKCYKEVKKEECLDCLMKNDEKYDKCMKHILGSFLNSTCGHHHGHEICDLFVDTKYKEEDVSACFLLKAGRLDTAKSDSLFGQFYDCSIQNHIDIITIVNNKAIETGDRYSKRYRNRMKGIEKKWCLIFRQEVARILYEFYLKKYNEI